jgi:microsomal dipeptidase-like Zn-dependent dipeptidase
VGIVSRTVDRAVNRTALPGRLSAAPEVIDLVRRAAVVDLLVGSALFRDSFVYGGQGGHVDLPRLRSVGVNVVGMTVATSWPDVRGSLSRWHFRSLGLPAGAAGSRMAIAEWVIGRIERWEAESAGGLRIVRSPDDLSDCLDADEPGHPVGVLLGVQGAHALDGDLANVARLRRRGVRMFAPAHVMDNDAVGSGTGRRAGGLSGFGRELLAELERQRLVVDLAHMSTEGITDALALLRRPFLMSHTGIQVSDVPPRHGRRRYTPGRRNVPAEIGREIGARGGLVGMVLSTQLIGGASLADAVAMIVRAIDVAGEDHVALGSDMDGALKMVVDVEGLPALAGALLGAVPEAQATAFLGGNAARFLRASLA